MALVPDPGAGDPPPDRAVLASGASTATAPAAELNRALDVQRLRARRGATAAREMERDAVVLVNRARARQGCRALVHVDALRLASRRHSRLMADRRTLSHRLPSEPTLRQRTSAAGYRGATMLGEVIMVGARTATAAIASWMNSPPHRAILLDCRLRALGPGVARSGDGRWWWTVDVGRR